MKLREFSIRRVPLLSGMTTVSMIGDELIVTRDGLEDEA
jgi:hypothetical protein